MKNLLVLTASSLVAAAAPAAAAPAGDHAAKQQLAEVRQATAKYRDVAAAFADGYVRLSGCVAVPGLGGMGFHYGKLSLFGAPIDLLQPALLLYASSGNGLRLVAVEYFHVDADQDLATDDDRPSLFGQPFDGPMEGHEEGMPRHYDLHVWLWQANPSGIFAQFNPNVRC